MAFVYPMGLVCNFDECAHCKERVDLWVKIDRSYQPKERAKSLLTELKLKDDMLEVIREILEAANGNFEDDRGERAYLIMHEHFDQLERIVEKAKRKEESR